MFVEDLKILVVKRNISMSELARRLGESPQNYHLKIKRNTIKDIDLKEAAKAMDCEIEVIYRDKATGEEVYKSKL